MDISVIIVSYNSAAYIGQCLEAVRKASAGLSCETIIVDNNSADNTCETVSLLFPWAILIRNVSNTGFAAGCNKGIRASAGRFILILNPDTCIGDTTLKECLSFMEATPGAGAAGVRMIDGDGCFLKESKRSFPTPLGSFFKLSGLSGLFPGVKTLNSYYGPETDNQEPASVEVLTGAFMFIRAEVLERTGLLDEDFFMYGEDIDLSFRIIKAGYLNFYLPALTIIHYKGKSTQRNGYADIHTFYDAMRIFIRKRSADGKYRHIAVPLQAAVYIRESAALLGRFVRLRTKNFFMF
ncbi:MAG: glycosyltransferase family 2 protein [Bacteroidales bacterium]|jgi:GT2 family glycosyltransferase|nr:glycosyltransferase family 2 protein [Bacteroidales bacterium]